MRRRPHARPLPVLLLALAALLLGTRPARASSAPVTLEGPPLVDGLLVADATGDGIDDLLLLRARDVYVYAGRARDLPDPKPTSRVALEDDVDFVDAAPPTAPGGAGLLVLGPRGLRHVALDTGASTPVEGAPDPPSWRDAHKAAFVDLARADGTLLLPTPTGWRVLGGPYAAHGPVDLAAPPLEMLEPAGGFLEDAARIVIGHPRLVLGRCPAGAPDPGAPSLWTLSGRSLLAFVGDQQVAYDAGFLPPEGVRRVLDLDADGAPDLVLEQGTNREGSYAFFRTPRPTFSDGKLLPGAGGLRPPAAVLRLEGFQLDPDYVDLDGDGRLDFVVTTIPIDARNTARAILGQVTASTLAFLQREEGGLYPQSPDASISSDIGVRLRFSQAGNIDVSRSFTILARGDFDGDRRKDLLIRTGPETLEVHGGVPGTVWAAEGRKVSIPPVGASPNVEGYVGDLEGRGQDQVILLYRAPPGGQDLVRVIAP